MPNKYKHTSAWIDVEQSFVSVIVLCPNLEFKELIHIITCMGGDMAYFTSWTCFSGKGFRFWIGEVGTIGKEQYGDQISWQFWISSTRICSSLRNFSFYPGIFISEIVYILSWVFRMSHGLHSEHSYSVFRKSNRNEFLSGYCIWEILLIENIF